MLYSLAQSGKAITSTAKTMVLLIPGASKPATIIALDFSFSASVLTLVELVSSTQATNGIAGTDASSSIVQYGDFRGADDVAALCGARTEYTAEPTVLRVLRNWRHSGQFSLEFPLGREPSGLVSGATRHRAIGLRFTAASNVNCDWSIVFAE